MTAQRSRVKPYVVPLDPEIERIARDHLSSSSTTTGAPAVLAPANFGAREGVATVPHQRTASPNRNPSWHRPVFILAPARSNSSVVGSMVGMHPELYGFPELSLFRAARVGQLMIDPPGARGPTAAARTAGLARTIAQLHDGRQDEEAVDAARRWLAERTEWDVACILDHLLSMVAPAVGLEKSPENSNRQDYMERLADAYPRARFLHVTRHPVSTVRSMHKVWSSPKLWDIPDDRFHLYLLGTWLFNHSRIKRFTSQLPPDRWMRVRSEDVLNKPTEYLPEICRWLGIDTGDAALREMMHPERSPYASLGPSNARGGNDPAFLKSPVPRATELPTTLDLPPDWEVDPWMHLALVEFAASIGYPHVAA